MLTSTLTFAWGMLTSLMTPLKSGRQLASAIAGSNAVVLPGAGHMLTAERPDDVLFALAKAQA